MTTFLLICFGIFVGIISYFIGLRRGLKTLNEELEAAKEEWYISQFPQTPEDAGIFDCGTYGDEPDVHMKDGTINVNVDRALRDERAAQFVGQLEELFQDEDIMDGGSY